MLTQASKAACTHSIDLRLLYLFLSILYWSFSASGGSLRPKITHCAASHAGSTVNSTYWVKRIGRRGKKKNCLSSFCALQPTDKKLPDNAAAAGTSWSHFLAILWRKQCTGRKNVMICTQLSCAYFQLSHSHTPVPKLVWKRAWTDPKTGYIGFRRSSRRQKSVCQNYVVYLWFWELMVPCQKAKIPPVGEQIFKERAAIFRIINDCAVWRKLCWRVRPSIPQFSRQINFVLRSSKKELISPLRFCDKLRPCARSFQFGPWEQCGQINAFSTTLGAKLMSWNGATLLTLHESPLRGEPAPK